MGIARVINRTRTRVEAVHKLVGVIPSLWVKRGDTVFKATNRPKIGKRHGIRSAKAVIFEPANLQQVDIAVLVIELAPIREALPNEIPWQKPVAQIGRNPWVFPVSVTTCGRSEERRVGEVDR